LIVRLCPSFTLFADVPKKNVAISALEPDEDETTQVLIELVQWLRVGRPRDGFTTSEIRALMARVW
jgi:hypothetical protein